MAESVVLSEGIGQLSGAALLGLVITCRYYVVKEAQPVKEIDLHFILHSTMRAVCLAIMTMGFALNAHSADLGGHVEMGGSIKDDRHAPRSNWELTFVPYLWAFWLDADQTVQGQSVSLNAHLFELLSESDGLNAMPWSSYQELRNGRFAFYGDIQYANVAFSGGQSRGPVSIDGAVDFELAVLEGGVSYEVGRWTNGGQTAIDVFAGLRYWYMNVGIDLSLTTPPPLPIGGTSAQSGSVDWFDPVLGFSVRHQTAPGQSLFAKFDIGGFGVGSDFTWQALGLYSFDIGRQHGITFSGKLGYRALGVDYKEGRGSTAFRYDSIQHGPILGLGMKW